MCRWAGTNSWASELSKEAVGKLLHTVPWTNSLTKSNAAHCEHPGERPDERKQIKITRADSQDTWASELSKEAVGANKVLCWSPDAFVRCQKLFQTVNLFDQRFEPACKGDFSHGGRTSARFLFVFSSLKTPPVIGASAEMGASAQGRE